VLERLEALEERVRALPGLTQNTLKATLDERLAALPRSLSALDVEGIIAERLTTDLETIFEDELTTLASKVMEGLVPRIEAMIAEKIAKLPAPARAAPAGAAASIDPAAVKEIVDRSVNEARTEILSSVDGRSQQVATELIQGFGVAQKQLTTRVEERISKAVGDQVAQFEELISQKTTDALGSFANSAAFKETLDKRFRVMLQHLESDVIPRIVKKVTAPPVD